MNYIGESARGDLYLVHGNSGEWRIFRYETSGASGVALTPCERAEFGLSADEKIDMLQDFLRLADSIEGREMRLNDFLITRRTEKAPEWLMLDEVGPRGVEREEFSALHTPSGKLVRFDSAHGGKTAATGPKELLEDAAEFLHDYVAYYGNFY